MKMLWSGTLILSALVHVNVASKTNSETYLHILPNGDHIQCRKCQQGTYLKSNCTANGQEAVCAPCQNGTFQPDLNVAHSCAACKTSCKYHDREYIFKSCTSIADMVCICKDGYYRETWVPPADALCVTDKPCAIGYKVNVKGDGTNATTCVPCLVGYFSDKESFSTNCTRCQSCVNGEAMPCNASSDAKCLGKVPSINPAIVAGVIIGVTITLLLIALGILVKKDVIRIPCSTSRVADASRKKICWLPRICLPLFQNLCIYSKPGSRRLSSEERPCIDTTGNGTVGDLDLLHLSEDLVGPDWQLFFYELFDGNAKFHIDQVSIDLKDMGIETKIHALLLRWKKNNNMGATRMQLTKALCSRDMNDVAKKRFPQEFHELMGS